MPSSSLNSLAMDLIAAVNAHDGTTLATVLALPEVRVLGQRAATLVDDDHLNRVMVRVLTRLGGAVRCGAWSGTPVANLLRPWTIVDHDGSAVHQMVGSLDTWENVEADLYAKVPEFLATLMGHVTNHDVLQAPGNDGRAVMFNVIRMQNATMFEHVLNHTDVTKIKADPAGNTLLMWAAYQGTPAMVARLVALNHWSGSDTNHKGLNVLHHAVSRPLSRGSAADRCAVIEHVWPLLTSDQVWGRTRSEKSAALGGQTPLDLLLMSGLARENEVLEKILACPWPEPSTATVQDWLWPAASQAARNRTWGTAMQVVRAMPIDSVQAWLTHARDDHASWWYDASGEGQKEFLGQINAHLEAAALTSYAQSLPSLAEPSVIVDQAPFRPRL